ncbi:hypothetical protein QQZ08_004935 [Neonectria magnoliae]|uniref:BZIP domain-containing protein n=1 Tax=Neonectria magnoliae TaxID=2732573 RepID=A0ABR1I6D1_9HYPO
MNNEQPAQQVNPASTPVFAPAFAPLFYLPFYPTSTPICDPVFDPTTVAGMNAGAAAFKDACIAVAKQEQDKANFKGLVQRSNKEVKERNRLKRRARAVAEKEKARRRREAEDGSSSSGKKGKKTPATMTPSASGTKRTPEAPM